MISFAKLIKESGLWSSLQNERATIVNYLIHGNLTDFAEYRYCQGQLVGLQKAITLLETLFKQEEE